MTKQSQRAFGLPTKMFNVISPESPRHAEGHDEWLLDEALAETFPASDSIAVSPVQLLRASPLRRSRKVEESSRTSGCDEDPKVAALDTPIECDHCHTGIPATVALSFEGADYVYHFCGPQCFEAWSNEASARGK